MRAAPGRRQWSQWTCLLFQVLVQVLLVPNYCCCCCGWPTPKLAWVICLLRQWMAAGWYAAAHGCIHPRKKCQGCQVMINMAFVVMMQCVSTSCWMVLYVAGDVQAYTCCWHACDHTGVSARTWWNSN